MARRAAATPSRAAGLVALVLIAAHATMAQQQAAATAAATAAAPAATGAVAGSPIWGAYQRQAAAAYGGNGTDLSSVMVHAYRTPLDSVLGADVYTGSNARLRRVVNDLQNGNAITVLAVGGVATNGSDASQPGANDYVAQYIAYLQNAFPSATITAKRHSAGVAPSSIVAYCSDK
jgi:hypothetical protein